MARYVFQSQVKDGCGRVITGATVSVVLAGTSTAASVYTSKTSTTVVNSVTTDSHGYFSFYFDDFDYDSSQTFDLTVTKDAYVEQTYASVRPEVVPGTYTISTAKTVATNVVVPSGVVYAKSGSGTINFTGSFSAGLYQVFSGFSAGNITFSNGTIDAAYPQWWGADKTGATSSSTAIDCAIDSTKVGTIYGKIRLTSGTWKCNFNIKNKLIVSGNGDSTILIPDTNAPVIGTASGVAVTCVLLEDFKIDGSATQVTYTSQDGIHLEPTGTGNFIDKITLRNLSIISCGAYGIYAKGTSVNGPYVQELITDKIESRSNTKSGMYLEGVILSCKNTGSKIYTNGDASTPNCEIKATSSSAIPSNIEFDTCIINGISATPLVVTALAITGGNYVRVVNCDLENAITHIHLSDSNIQHTEIIGNRMSSNFNLDNFILVDNCKSLKIENNKFIVASGKTAGAGINFNGAHSDLLHIKTPNLNAYGGAGTFTKKVSWGTEYQTIGSGKLPVYRDYITVEGEGAAADDLVNLFDEDNTAITKTPDGYTVTLVAYNAAHAITCKSTGGNLQLVSDRVLNSAGASLTLRFVESLGKWREIAFTG